MRSIVFVTALSIVTFPGITSGQNALGPVRDGDAAPSERVFDDWIKSRESVGYEGPINRFSLRGISFSRDGKYLAAAAADGVVFVWPLIQNAEVAGRLARRARSHEDYISSIAWANDRQFVTGGGDGLVHLFDWHSLRPETGRPSNILDSKPLRTFEGHTDDVHAVGVSGDGELLISAGKDGQVIIWNLKSGNIVRRIAAHDESISTLDISPDDRLLATGSRDQTIRLWELSTGRQVAKLTGHEGDVVSAQFSPAGSRLASVSSDETIRVWDIDHGRTVLTLKGHTGRNLSVSYSPDGKRLASTGQDSVRMWDSQTGDAIWTVQLDGRIFTAAQTVTENPTSVAFSMKHNTVAVASTAGIVTFLNEDNGSVVEYGQRKRIQKFVAWARLPQE